MTFTLTQLLIFVPDQDIVKPYQQLENEYVMLQILEFKSTLRQNADTQTQTHTTENITTFRFLLV